MFCSGQKRFEEPEATLEAHRWFNKEHTVSIERTAFTLHTELNPVCACRPHRLGRVC